MSTVWPTAKAGLLALLPTLSGFTLATSGVTDETLCLVYSGFPSGDASRSYLAVGWTEDNTSRGSWRQIPSGDGFFDGEAGDVLCTLYMAADESDQDAADVAAYALVDTIKAALTTDRTFGALPKGSTSSLGADDQSANLGGAGVLLILTLSYATPIC